MSTRNTENARCQCSFRAIPAHRTVCRFSNRSWELLSASINAESKIPVLPAANYTDRALNVKSLHRDKHHLQQYRVVAQTPCSFSGATVRIDALYNTFILPLQQLNFWSNAVSKLCLKNKRRR